MNIETIPHLEVFTAPVWEKVNLNLLAKSLAELMHEDVAKPAITESKKNLRIFCMATKSTATKQAQADTGMVTTVGTLLRVYWLMLVQ